MAEFYIQYSTKYKAVLYIQNSTKYKANLLVFNVISSLQRNVLHINPFKCITCYMAITFKSANITRVQLTNETDIFAVCFFFFFFRLCS